MGTILTHMNAGCALIKKLSQIKENCKWCHRPVATKKTKSITAMGVWAQLQTI
jgi:hypothetical protein